MVLFALILVAGMLVDGAIVVSELADRHLHEGQTAHQAWLNAASRMSWPVIASTATTLAVFLPLLFWPGVVGQFMKYLPATVILCLLASLVMALIFLPTLGRLFTRTAKASGAGTGPMDESTTLGRSYRHLLSRLLRYPGWVLAFALLLIALLVCLIPTTIGGLLPAIGIAGMNRALSANVLAKSGKAVEVAGDIDVLLLDKTGTITHGNCLFQGNTHFFCQFTQ